ncbi:hypothetical protein FRACA_990022 [Frankia canadensis]|uniref:Uncharacterized protein n=1 Tax=Frankia canadensis TaxID=1836972 RepID=A0A2I2L2Y9_9ACTN|nr:hypothetical protein FRACA_990022 [Frankia canadensis]SOU59572.1 hypothetical protein FRACA_990022 [Frankia canadensis]
MHAHDGAGGGGAELDEVAELVGEPQAAPAAEFEVRAPPAGEPVGHQTRVGHLTDQVAGCRPEPHGSPATAVAHAVGGHLVHGEFEIVDAIGVEALAPRRVGDRRPHEPQVGGAERELGRRRAQIGQALGERVRPRLLAPPPGAGPGEPAVHHHRMGTPHSLSRVRVEGRRLVDAAQSPARRPDEGLVEQRLVQQAFPQLRRGTFGPDRLPDTAHRPATGQTALDELPPGREEAGRIAADLVQIEEFHAFHGPAEGGAQLRGPLRRQHDEHVLVSRETSEDKISGGAEESDVTAIQKCLMPNTVGTGRSKRGTRGHSQWALPFHHVTRRRNLGSGCTRVVRPHTAGPSPE